MSHIPYHTEDDTPSECLPDGSAIDAVFSERDVLRAEVDILRALLRHVNETPKSEHDREDVLTDDDVADIFGAPV